MAAKEVKEKGLIINKRNGVMDFKVFRLDAGESRKLTSADRANELVMARINRAEELGFVELT